MTVEEDLGGLVEEIAEWLFVVGLLFQDPVVVENELAAVIHHGDDVDVGVSAVALKLEGNAGAAAVPVAVSVVVSAAGKAAPGAASASGLSSRELEVLERIAAGDSNKLIARAFDLSPHTVKRHVANILDKLALDSRGRAAAWYREYAAS